MGSSWVCLPIVIQEKLKTFPEASAWFTFSQVEIRVFGSSHTDGSGECLSKILHLVLHSCCFIGTQEMSRYFHKRHIGAGLPRLARPTLAELLSRMRSFSEVDKGLTSCSKHSR